MKKSNNKSQNQVSKVIPFKPREGDYLTEEQVSKLIEDKYPRLNDKSKSRSPFNELVLLLVRWRLSRGLSQAAVATRAKVALSTYQLIEEGRPSANPGLKTLWKVARVYGVESLKEFWAGPGNQYLST